MQQAKDAAAPTPRHDQRRVLVMPRRAIYAVGFARWCESSDVDRGREDCQHLGGHLSAELLAGVVI
jgi:hypothetical protein